MSDRLIAVFIGIALAGHIAALIAALMGRGARPALVLDIAVAVAVLAYIAAHPKAFAMGIDWAIVWLAVFEVAVLVVAIPPLIAARQPFAGAWVAFGLHTAALAAALIFALTFRIDRLF